MNADLLLKYIDHPEMMSATENENLKQILEEYPYFQTVHLLYIKNLHQYKNIRYSDQLKVAATYAGDRSILFSLIKKEAPKLETINESKEVIDLNIFEEKVSDLEVIKEFEQLEDKKEILQEESVKTPIDSEKVDFENEVVKKDENVILLETTEIQSSEIYTNVDHTKSQLKELINNRLHEIEIEHKNEEHSQKDGSDDNDEANLISNQPDLLDFSFDFSPEEKDSEIDKTENKNKKTSNNLSGDLQLQFIDYLTSFNQKISSDDEGENTSTGENIHKQIALIDKFLIKQPRLVSKHPHKEYDYKDISSESVQENEFMSETLAKIYIKQKNYDAAIKIYQKLSLKYPQKNVYFAEQISEIKKLTNNN